MLTEHEDSNLKIAIENFQNILEKQMIVAKNKFWEERHFTYVSWVSLRKYLTNYKPDIRNAWK